MRANYHRSARRVTSRRPAVALAIRGYLNANPRVINMTGAALSTGFLEARERQEKRMREREKSFKGDIGITREQLFF